MKTALIPVEVVVHFGIDGIITPYKIKYAQDSKKTLTICKILKHETNTYAGHVIELFECAALAEGGKLYLTLNYEREINKWFFSQI